MFLSSGEACTKCNCNDIRHSRVRAVDWAFTLFGFFPIRCINCNARFFRRRRVAPVASP